MLQKKIISDGFKVHGLNIFRENGFVITAIKIDKNSNTFFGSAANSAMLKIEDQLSGIQCTNKTFARFHKYGIPIMNLDSTDNNIASINNNSIRAATGIARERISYVFGGTNLFWHNADSVFFRNQIEGKYYRKKIPADSLWYDKPLYYFYQIETGEANIELFQNSSAIFNPKEYFMDSIVNIAVSGRPILLNGHALNLYMLLNNGLTPAEHFFLEKGDLRHLLPMVRLEYFDSNEQENKTFYLGMKEIREKKNIGINYIREKEEPLLCNYDINLFSREIMEQELSIRYPDTPYELDYKKGRVYFSKGLPKAIYPHNVLGVDIAGNSYLVQFHGESAWTGPTIEYMQSTLIELGIHSAIVTSNGLDVFLYDVRNSLYYSQSRNLEDVLAQKDRPSQHLMFIYQGDN